MDLPEGLPNFVMGMSRGGLMAIRLAQIRQDLFSGCILNVPWIDVHESAKPGLILNGVISVVNKMAENQVLVNQKIGKGRNKETSEVL